MRRPNKVPKEVHVTISNCPRVVRTPGNAPPGTLFRARKELGELLKTRSIKSHILKLAALHNWSDAHGNNVGLRDLDGFSLEEELEKILLRAETLLQDDSPVKLPEAVRLKLLDSTALLDPEITQTTKKVLLPVEEALTSIKHKALDLEDHPDYLFQFRCGGEFRVDLHKAFSLMEKSHPAYGKIANSVWVLRHNAATHFLTDAKLVKKRLEIAERNMVQPGLEGDNMEYMAQFELHEELRAEILQCANEGVRNMEVAKRMPGLMQGHLKLMHSGIAGQVKGLFDDEARELGETDADSLIIALYSLNRCLLALVDIQRSKKVIPTLA